MNLCFLDLETTGLDPKKDSIIEFSFLVQDEKGKELSRFDQVLIPERSPLTPYVTHITGITAEELKENGKYLAEIMPEVTEKIRDSVIVGHNIGFDIQFLKENGLDLISNNYLDTHELARILLIDEESYALEILSEKYGFNHSDAHRAMSDVEASAELFSFLKQKITALPAEFLAQIKDSLENKTDWLAKSFFLETKGVDNFSLPKKELPKPPNTFSLPENFDSSAEKLSPSFSLFINQGNSIMSADFLVSAANNLVSRGERILVVSPKLEFFPSLEKFPTPEVLFDPQKLKEFVNKRDKLGSKEAAFFLQCSWRNYLGLRGKNFFALFAGQRELWDEVCVEKADNEVFASVLQKKQDEKILVISPQAFFRFHDLEIFNNRILLIDEAEIFAEKLLFAPSKEISLVKFLEDEKTSVSAHFFVTNFCKDIIEPRMQHTITPFPEKILLGKGDLFPEQIRGLKKISSDPKISAIEKILTNPKEGSVRWLKYFPETGNLSFGTWHPDDWRKTKSILGSFRKIFFHRHKIIRDDPFFRVFVGSTEGEFLQDTRLGLNKELEIPTNLESANDPQFNSFCATKILELSESIDEKNGLLANFSSLETLKKVFSEVSEPLLESNVFVKGERVSGGSSKVLELLKRSSNILLFTQKLIDPSLAELPISTIVVQKFPFPPPHPLLKELENVMKQSGQSFWNSWVAPQVTANISRRISVYPHAKKVIWLDPRENSSWGKELLKSLFKLA
ncbi:3'-5' exonuclease [Candidatus Gracilibacteria bacterium]|nr:3'-5' exonuclease [Candidatus Gracilibacteria bacterium]